MIAVAAPSPRKRASQGVVEHDPALLQRFSEHIIAHQFVLTCFRDFAILMPANSAMGTGKLQLASDSIQQVAHSHACRLHQSGSLAWTSHTKWYGSRRWFLLGFGSFASFRVG